MEMPKNVAYCVTCQTSIWNRKFLLGLAERNESAWEFERYGSFMVSEEKRPLLVTQTKEFPFVDAVHKGYWEKFGLAVCRKNGIDLSGSTRTLPPFKARLVEGIKAIIFRIVPTTLLVKFQNRFALGAKEATPVSATPAGGIALPTAPAGGIALPTAPAGGIAMPSKPPPVATVASDPPPAATVASDPPPAGGSTTSATAPAAPAASKPQPEGSPVASATAPTAVAKRK